MSRPPAHAVSILLIDDDPAVRAVVERTLRQRGPTFRLEYAGSVADALAAVLENRHEVYLVDDRLPGDAGRTLITTAKAHGIDKPFILLTGPDADAAGAVEAGAEDYLDTQLIEYQLERAIRYVLQRRHALTALRQREHLYRQIVESAHEGIWMIDRDARTTYANRAMAEMIGYTEAEMLGRPMYDFMDDDARLQAARNMDRRRAGLEEQHEFPLLHKNGRRVWTLMETSALQEPTSGFVGALAMVVDITARKQSEEQLRRSEQRLKTIIAAEPACVKLVSPEGAVLDMNGAGLAMVEADDLSQVLGHSVAALVHPEDRERFSQFHHDASQGHGGRLDFRIVGLRGSVRWVASHSVPFDTQRDDAGPPYVVLSVTTDVTERNQLEEQLRQAQKMDAIGRLAGGIAHDFNNLLTVILGNCDEAIGQLEPQAPLSTELAEIRAAGDQATALTAQLLAFGRKQVLNRRVIDLNATVSSVLTMLPRLLSEDIRTSAELAPQPTPIHADPDQLTQVLLNLAVNARDAMPTGGTLTIRTAAVELRTSPVAGVRLFQPGVYGLLEVTDTGTGMDGATQARIFEPFFTTKEKGHGTGLGLATVYGIVKQSGGFIVTASAPGRGTTFKIYLPTADEPIDERPRALAPSVAGGTETVLLVEDARGVRELVRRVLEQKGYTVLMAEDAQEALDLATRRGTAIDVLVTDVIMPGMSGPALASTLTRRWPSIRVLFMSGYSDDAIARRAGADQPVTLLHKPFTASQLAAVVREILDRPPSPVTA